MMTIKKTEKIFIVCGDVEILFNKIKLRKYWRYDDKKAMSTCR